MILNKYDIIGNINDSLYIIGYRTGPGLLLISRIITNVYKATIKPDCVKLDITWEVTNHEYINGTITIENNQKNINLIRGRQSS